MDSQTVTEKERDGVIECARVRACVRACLHVSVFESVYERQSLSVYVCV